MVFALGNRSYSLRRAFVPRCRVHYRARYPFATHKPVVALFSVVAPRRRNFAFGVLRAAEQDAEGSFSGEWPMNWSLASYEDLSDYYGGKLLKEEGMGGYHLSDIMSKDVILTSPTTTRQELITLFEEHTGLPVVDREGRLLGVVSRSDLKREGEVVKDLMSTPPIAAKPTARVADAACLMLKHKVHRIPIVGPNAKVLGFVTRTDIFEALEAETEISEGLPK